MLKNKDIYNFIFSVPLQDVFKNTYGHDQIVYKYYKNYTFMFNIDEIAKYNKREPLLFTSFLSQYHNVTFKICHLYGNKIYYCNKYINNIENSLQEFIDIFVKCKICGNIKTIFIKDKITSYKFCTNCNETNKIC